MSGIPDLCIDDFNYHLPEQLIALYPEKQRDRSKLLVWDSEKILTDTFGNLPEFVPENTLLIFNDTRVINARLKFEKPSGARVEIFVLEPLSPSSEINIAFGLPSGVIWKCMVGNLKRWKSGVLSTSKMTDGTVYTLNAEIAEKFQGTCNIRFTWNPGHIAFSVILGIFGIIPLPPYIHRETEPADLERYQTVYARTDGSVAAPTAGLHFTGKVMHDLKSKKIHTEYLTLHVGAGTFKPVENDKVSDHQMHEERVFVTKKTISRILSQVDPVMAVGTTSVRTLESLYLFACKLIRNKNAAFMVDQWYPYQDDFSGELTRHQAMEVLLDYLERNKLEYLSGITSLMILPGYRYQMIDGMITNFHMPKSTLLLLVSAFIGNRWKSIYEYAVANHFRFLSYGDACLFLK